MFFRINFLGILNFLTAMRSVFSIKISIIKNSSKIKTKKTILLSKFTLKTQFFQNRLNSSPYSNTICIQSSGLNTAVRQTAGCRTKLSSLRLSSWTDVRQIVFALHSQKYKHCSERAGSERCLTTKHQRCFHCTIDRREFLGKQDCSASRRAPHRRCPLIP